MSQKSDLWVRLLAGVLWVGLVGVVVGRTVRPYPVSESGLKTEFGSVVNPKNVVVGNHAIDIERTFVSVWLRVWRRSRGRFRFATNGTGFGRRNEVGLLANQPPDGSLTSEDYSTWWSVRLVYDLIFWWRPLSALQDGQNVSVYAGRASIVNTVNPNAHHARIGRIGQIESDTAGSNISPIFDLATGAKLQPLHAIKDQNPKSENSKDYLGAIIDPPSKTGFGYVLILFGLVIDYLGFCAFYNGWYRRTHQLRRGALGLAVGLGLIASSVFLLSQGYILAFF
jgi:hypothetical protein